MYPCVQTGQIPGASVPQQYEDNKAAGGSDQLSCWGEAG